MTSVASVITPCNSQEVEYFDQKNAVQSSPTNAAHWLSKLQSGISLTADEWNEFSKLKTTLQYNIQTQRNGSGNNNISSKIIRIHGMVQDILDPEYFTKSNDDCGINRYTDESSSFQLAERVPTLIVPIPFTNIWFRDLEKLDANNASCNPERDKNEMLHEPSSKRLKLEFNCIQNDCQKESLQERNNSHNNWWNAEVMNSDTRQQPALAKFYYDQYGSDATRLKLNDLVEIVGIIECDEDNNDETIKTGTNDDSDPMDICGFGMFEDDSRAIPSSIPRIHVLCFQPVLLDDKVRNFHHKGPNELSSPSNDGTVPTVLAKLCQTSTVTASAIWMTLLSMAERNRQYQDGQDPFESPILTPQETTLGCTSLNLITSNIEEATRVQHQLEMILREIVPVLNVFSITNEFLHNFKTPRRADGRMIPSVLQLPKGSTLILNVSGLNPRCLPASNGQVMKSLQALQTLTNSHSILYEFDGGMFLPFEADYRIFVISTDTTKHVLPCMMQTKWELPASDCTAALDASSVRWLRDTLATLRTKSDDANNNNIGLSRTLLERAQNDFVERRQQQRRQCMATKNNIHALPGETEFHRWLTLTRLSARGRSVQSADMCDWEHALQLDDAMIATLL